MKIDASTFHTLFKPSLCDLRVFLKHQGEQEDPADPYFETLKKLGDLHEQNHLRTFDKYTDLSRGPDREIKTLDALKSTSPVLYQARLTATTEIDGNEIIVIGEPDFLIRYEEGHIIRDAKMARRVSDRDHPEIIHQLQLYGWLYKKIAKNPAVRLEVINGKNEIIEIEQVGEADILDLLKRIIQVRETANEPYSPVGWSKCGGCPFKTRCWDKAIEKKDVATLIGVDQNLAVALRKKEITTISELLNSFNVESLAEFKKPWGKRTQKVGKAAEMILMNARANIDKKEIVLKPPQIPQHSNYVMFDLEGLPPHLEELDKIYLWGLQVYGENAGQFRPALAGFGIDGDREGWDNFLSEAESIFNNFGDIPFVHWAPYEKTFLKRYIERFGDRDGIAERVQNNLLDLLPIARESLALPLPSFSLKVIEKHIGFKRTQDEYGGQWSIAKYIEATELEDSQAREAIMDEILRYNEEDLASMWAILVWLQSRTTNQTNTP